MSATHMAQQGMRPSFYGGDEALAAERAADTTWERERAQMEANNEREFARTNEMVKERQSAFDEAEKERVSARDAEREREMAAASLAEATAPKSLTDSQRSDAEETAKKKSDEAKRSAIGSMQQALAPVAEQTEGGWFGIGAEPTNAAKDATAKIQALQAGEVADADLADFRKANPAVFAEVDKAQSVIARDDAARAARKPAEEALARAKAIKAGLSPEEADAQLASQKPFSPDANVANMQRIADGGLIEREVARVNDLASRIQSRRASLAQIDAESQEIESQLVRGGTSAQLAPLLARRHELISARRAEQTAIANESEAHAGAQRAITIREQRLKEAEATQNAQTSSESATGYLPAKDPVKATEEVRATKKAEAEKIITGLSDRTKQRADAARLASEQIEAQVRTGKLTPEVGAKQRETAIEKAMQEFDAESKADQGTLEDSLNDYAAGTIDADTLNSIFHAAGASQTGVESFRENQAAIQKRTAIVDALEKAALGDDYGRSNPSFNGEEMKLLNEIANLQGDAANPERYTQMMRSYTADEFGGSSPIADTPEEQARQEANFSKQRQQQADEVKAKLREIRETGRAKLTAELVKRGVTDPAEQAKLIAETELKAAAKARPGFMDVVASRGGVVDATLQKLPFAGGVFEATHILPYAMTALALESGQTPPPEELEALAAFVRFSSENPTFIAKALDGVTALPGFATELYATGGIATAVKKAGNAGLKAALTKMATAQGKEQLAKVMARSSADNVVGAWAKGNAKKALAYRIGSGFVQEAVRLAPASAGRMVGAFTKDSALQGVELSSVEGKLVATIGEDRRNTFGRMADTVVDSYIENLSERSGAYALGALGKMTPAVIKDGLAKMGNAAKGGLMKAAFVKSLIAKNPGIAPLKIQRFLKGANIGSTFEEMLEERVGTAARDVWAGVSKNEWGITMPSPEDLAVEMVTFMVPGAANAISTNRHFSGLDKAIAGSDAESTERINSIDLDPQAQAERLTKLGGTTFDAADITRASDLVGSIAGADSIRSSDKTQAEYMERANAAIESGDLDKGSKLMQMALQQSRTRSMLADQELGQAALAAAQIGKARAAGKAQADQLRAQAQAVLAADPKAKKQAEAIELQAARFETGADRVSALVKIARGRNDALTTAEKNALGDAVVNEGQGMIITDAAREEAEAIAPAAAVYIKQTETMRREQLSRDQAQAAGVAPAASTPAPATPAASPAPTAVPARGTSTQAGGVPSATGTVTAQGAATAPPAGAAPVGGKLPKDLAGANPRYNHGSKAFEVEFENDIDKAAYIAAQENPSKRDADYVAWAVQASGMTEQEVRDHGKKVRAKLKEIGAKSNSGKLKLKDQMPQAGNSQSPASQTPANPAPAPASAPATKPAVWKGVGVSGKTAEIPADEAATQDEAEKKLIKKLGEPLRSGGVTSPKGKGTTAAKPAASTPAAKPAAAPAPTAADKQADRLRTVGEQIDALLPSYRDAFTDVVEESGKGRRAWLNTKTGALHLNRQQFAAQSADLDDAALAAEIETIIRHEWIHAGTVAVRNDAQAAAFWEQLGKSKAGKDIQAAALRAYNAPYEAKGAVPPSLTDAQSGYEAYRMLYELARDGKLSETTNIPESLAADIRSFLQGLVDWMRARLAKLPKKLRSQIERDIAEIEGALKKLTPAAPAAKAERPAPVDTEESPDLSIVRLKDGRLVHVRSKELAKTERPRLRMFTPEGSPIAGGVGVLERSDIDLSPVEDAPTVDAAAHEAATSPNNDKAPPTPDQAKAGNYEKGHFTLGGMDISIENPAGSVRHNLDIPRLRELAESAPDVVGNTIDSALDALDDNPAFAISALNAARKSAKGSLADSLRLVLGNNPWAVKMKSHYGDIKGTEGKDGDNLDIFITEGTPKDYDGPVFVVNQMRVPASKEFDEHKAVTGIGITTEEEAKAEYLANYSEGWKGAGSIVSFVNLAAFKSWAMEKKRVGELTQDAADSHSRAVSNDTKPTQESDQTGRPFDPVSQAPLPAAKVKELRDALDQARRWAGERMGVGFEMRIDDYERGSWTLQKHPSPADTLNDIKAEITKRKSKWAVNHVEELGRERTALVAVLRADSGVMDMLNNPSNSGLIHDYLGKKASDFFTDRLVKSSDLRQYGMIYDHFSNLIENPQWTESVARQIRKEEAAEKPAVSNDTSAPTFKIGDRVTADEGTGTIRNLTDGNAKLTLDNGTLTKFIPISRLTLAPAAANTTTAFKPVPGAESSAIAKDDPTYPYKFEGWASTNEGGRLAVEAGGDTAKQAAENAMRLLSERWHAREAGHSAKTQKAKEAESTREQQQKTYMKFRRALTKAVNAKDYAEIIKQADAFQAHYENGPDPFPDQWSDWERHKEEAEAQLRRQGDMPLRPLVEPLLKPASAPAPRDAADEALAQAFEGLYAADRAVDPVLAANRTARSAGAVGAKAITPRYVALTTIKGERVLNFGAGKPNAATGRYLHSDMVEEAGGVVREYDFGQNATGALGSRYRTVFASNVLNVQADEEMLRSTLRQIMGSMAAGGRAVFNFPESPRYLAMTADEVQTVIEEEFGSTPRRVGGTKKAPLWEAGESREVLAAADRPVADIEQADLPKDRRAAMLNAAGVLIDAEVKRPEELAARLEKLAPGGQLRKYSRSFWRLMSGFDSTLAENPDWNAIYDAVDNPATEDDTSSEEQPNDATKQPGDSGASDSNGSEESSGDGIGQTDLQDVRGGVDTEEGVGAVPTGKPNGGRRRGGKRGSDSGSRGDAEGSTNQPGEAGADSGSGIPVGGEAGSSDVRNLTRPPEGAPDANFVIGDDFSLPSGPKARIEANLQAIRLLREIEKEERNATAEEKAVLAKYSGWGSFKNAFNQTNQARWEKMQQRLSAAGYNQRFTIENSDDYRELAAWRDRWGSLHDQLTELLEPDEFRAMSKSILNAHYTSLPIIDSMWKIVDRLGFKGGKVLETSVGGGYFVGRQPKGLADKSEWNAVELDEITSRIFSKLYPEARINGEPPKDARRVNGLGFQQSSIPNNSIDLVIGNFPFDADGPNEATKEFGMKMNLHNYFFARSLDKVRPGGLVVAITSASTMDNNLVQRELLAGRAELVAAIRLPNTAFKDSAGTEVTTDIIILRKKDGSRDAGGEAWLHTAPVGTDVVTAKAGDKEAYEFLSSIPVLWVPVNESLREPWAEWRAGRPRSGEKWKAIVKALKDSDYTPKDGIRFTAPIEVNQYFENHPEMVMGKHTLAGAMYSAGEYAVAPDGSNLLERIDEAISKLPENVFGENVESELEKYTAVESQRGDREGSTIMRDGKVYQVIKRQLVPVRWDVDILEGIIDGHAMMKGNKALRAAFNAASSEMTAEDLDKYLRKLMAENLTPSAIADIEKKIASEVAKRTNVFASWVKVRDAARELVNAELDDLSDEKTEALREKLNETYDAHVAKFGAFGKRGQNPHGFLDDDEDTPLLDSLEDEELVSTDEKGKPAYRYVKRPIFSKAQLSKTTAPESAESIEDAVGISIGYLGRLSVPYMAKLLGTTETEAVSMLAESGLALVNPKTGLYETADMYLSGEVRSKLREAEKANLESGGQYTRNVELLKAVMPANRPIQSISINMGARWVPGEVYTQFAQEVLGLSQMAISYQPAANIWRIEEGGSSNKTKYASQAVTTEESFSTDRVGVGEIIDAILNKRQIAVYDTVGRGQRVFNSEATIEAKTKADQMAEKFNEWVKSSDSTVEVEGEEIRVGDLAERLYNENVAGVVPPSFKGDWVTLPGQSGEIWLKPHRRAVLARMLTLGYGMMAHGVGSGKTYNQIALAMELRRLGKARKVMTLVQNSTIKQFAASHMKAYPQSRILVADEKNFTARKRAKFQARIATGDYDSIILTHSNVALIGHDEQAIRNYMARAFDQLTAALADAEDGSTEQRDIQKAMDKLQEKLDKMLREATSRAGGLLTWEQLGIDALIVDEAHAFKNAPIVTRMARVKNLPNGDGSNQAIMMQMKVANVQATTGGKNIFFATGTPITNTMAEAYTMLNFIAPMLLEQRGIRNFDDFATTFGRTVSEPEATWKGEIENVERFAKFINGPELVNLIRSVFDVALGNESMGIRVPQIKGGKPRAILIEPTEASEIFNDWIIDTAAAFAAIPNKRKAFEAEPWLSAIPIMTMQAGMAQAIDPRLINPNVPDDPESKVNKTVDEVVRIYKQGEKNRTAQVIFSDLSNPFSTMLLRQFNGDPFEEFGSVNREMESLEAAIMAFQGMKDLPEADEREKKRLIKRYGDLVAQQFNLFEDIKAKLVAKGIPAAEIAIASSDMDRKKLQASFEKVNSGQIRIIMGSTARLGVGVNIQERLAGCHNLSPPRDFKPAMMEQRIGRIERQGNLHRDWADTAYIQTVEKYSKTSFEGKNLEERYNNAVKWLDDNDDNTGRGVRIRDLAEEAAAEFDVEVINYGLKLSMDSAVYSMMNAKQGFIEQVLMGENVLDEFDDPASEEAAGFALMAAEAMGNEDLKTKVVLDGELRKLRAVRAGYLRDQWNRKSSLESTQRSLQSNLRKDPAAIRAAGADFEGAFERVKKEHKSTRGTQVRVDQGKEAYEALTEEQKAEKITYFSEVPVYSFGDEVIDMAKSESKIIEPLNKFIVALHQRAKDEGRTVEQDIFVNDARFVVSSTHAKEIERATVRVSTPHKFTGGDSLYGYVSTYTGNPGSSLLQKLRDLATPGTTERYASAIEYSIEMGRKQAQELEKLIANQKPFPQESEFVGKATQLMAVEARLRAADTNPRNHRYYRALKRIAGEANADAILGLAGGSVPAMPQAKWDKIYIRLRIARRTAGKYGDATKTPEGITKFVRDAVMGDVADASNGAVSDDTEAFGDFINDQEGRSPGVRLNTPPAKDPMERMADESRLFDMDRRDRGAFRKRAKLRKLIETADRRIEEVESNAGKYRNRDSRDEQIQRLEARKKALTEKLAEVESFMIYRERTEEPLPLSAADRPIGERQPVLTAQNAWSMMLAPSAKQGIATDYIDGLKISLANANALANDRAVSPSVRQKARQDAATLQALIPQEEAAWQRIRQDHTPKQLKQIYDDATAYSVPQSELQADLDNLLADFPDISTRPPWATAQIESLRSELMAGGLSATDRPMSSEEFAEALDALNSDMPSESDLDDLRQRAGLDWGREYTDSELAGLSGSMRAGMRTAYDDKLDRQTHEAWNEQAHDLIDKDPARVLADLVSTATERGSIINPVQVKASQILLPQLMREAIANRDTKSFRMAETLTWAYDAAGTETARGLAARWQPHLSPEERHREVLAKIIFTPGAKDREDIKRAPTDRAQAEKVASLEKEIERIRSEAVDRERDMLRQVAGMTGDLREARRKDAVALRAEAKKELDALRAELKRVQAQKTQLQMLHDINTERLAKIEKAFEDMGITYHDLFVSREISIGLKTSSVVKNAMQPFTPKERQALQMMMDGRSDRQIANKTGISRNSMAGLEARFDKILDASLESLVRRGFDVSKAEGLDVDKLIDKAGNILAAADRPVATLTADEIKKRVGELRAIIKPTTAARNSGALRRLKGEESKEAPYGFDISRPEHAAMLMRAIHRMDGTPMDMVYEYWINGLLSGPATHTANIAGNIGNAALEYLIQRPIEALTNAVLFQNVAGASLGEYQSMTKYAARAASTAWRFARIAWNTEVSLFDSQWLNKPLVVSGNSGDKGQLERFSIPGTTGRVVRTPTRVLQFADEWAKHFFGMIEAAAQAHRLAKADGLKPGTEAFDDRVEQLVGIPGSPAWLAAVDKAHRLTFTNDLPGPLAKAQEMLHSRAETPWGAVIKTLLRFVFPFIRTPYNIFATGLRKTPLGSARMIGKGIAAWHGKQPFFDSYPQAALAGDIAEQLIGWGAAMALWALGEGDPDDEKKTILITGSRSRTDDRGEDQLLDRLRGGETTILINGKPVFNYGRYEPFATIISTLVDASRDIKKIKGGQKPTKAIGEAMRGVLDQARTKTFLQGLDGLMQLIEGRTSTTMPEQLRKFIVTGIVPNLVRQPIRNADEFARDTRNAPWYYHAIPLGGLAEPLYDLYGRPVEKMGAPLTRMLINTPVKPSTPANPADKALRAWNDTHPLRGDGDGMGYFPTNVDKSMMRYKDPSGKWQDMTPREAAELRRRGGIIMDAEARAAVTSPTNPTQDDIDRLKKARNKAFSTAKSEMFPGGSRPLLPVRRPPSLSEIFGQALRK